MLLAFRTNGGKTLIEIEEALDEFRIPRDSCRLLPMEPADPAQGPVQTQMSVRYCDVHRHHYEFLSFLAKIDGIEEIQRARRPDDTASSARGTTRG